MPSDVLCAPRDGSYQKPVQDGPNVAPDPVPVVVDWVETLADPEAVVSLYVAMAPAFVDTTVMC
jgi:hypothetical protein